VFFGVVLILACLVCPSRAAAQTELAGVYGRVTDPSGAVIVDAEVEIKNVETNVSVTVQTNQDGLYTIPSLHPGHYLINVRRSGFKSVTVTELTLNVQDNVVRNFALQVGSIAETVTIRADDLRINTTDASVSTVIDRKFVESLPLNGRSFNTLLQLTPGVTIVPSSSQNPGQFSVNGQRTDSNYFQVDGVSANFGTSSGQAFLYQAGNGGSQAFNAYGGTSSLVSVDAMQEFRVQTSSFAPQFGHTPGGQVSIVTRSGTNDFHGAAFDYFRNDVLDANDWFANRAGKARAPERQNDFGGVLGGRIFRDKTFFFLSYEGLRLRQPQTKVVEVPTVGLRNSAVPTAAPVLNAFPLPDDPSATGDTAPFTGSYSNPISMDAGSFRIDHYFSNSLGLFGRFNWAPSLAVTRENGLNNVFTTNVNTRTATVGVNYPISPRVNDAFRINFSRQSNDRIGTMDSFGGAVPIDSSLLLSSPFSLANTETNVTLLDLGPLTFDLGRIGGNTTGTQFNVLDDLSYSIGAHQLKMGFDYRRVSLTEAPQAIVPQYFVIPTDAFASNGNLAGVAFTASRGGTMDIRNVDSYLQDTWKVAPRLTLTYGLRWEVNPAPSASDGAVLSSWQNVESPATLTLAPVGTKVYGTTYGNVAPRVGIAYSLDERGSFVLRGGWGLFYDLGTGIAPILLQATPNTALGFIFGGSLPVPNLASSIPAFPTSAPFTSQGVFVIDPHLKVPYSNSWNLAVEKSFQNHQSLSVTYVGQVGQRLLRAGGIPPAQSGPNFPSGYYLLENASSSNYNALQVQYKRPLYKRVQALANYTWSHSIDNASTSGFHSFLQTGTLNSERGSSDFDVRHSFSGTVTVDLPSARGGFLRRVTENWSLAGVAQARSGLPIQITTTSISGVGSFVQESRPNLLPGIPTWVPDATAGPGKKLNVNAFATPPAGSQGNLPRNSIYGLGISQIDLSIQRDFPITERVRLSFRTDAFNVLNHPNFANPFSDWEPSSPSFGVFNQMLNRGLGGLNALYQIGGPRSLQLSLRLAF